jgi:hypothetical protein
VCNHFPNHLVDLCIIPSASLLLDRIIELENAQKYTVSANEAGQDKSPPSSAYPRALFSPRARSSFISNLRRAMAEVEAPDLMHHQHHSASYRRDTAALSRNPQTERISQPEQSVKYSRASMSEDKGKRRETQANTAYPVPVPVSSVDRNTDPALMVDTLITEDTRRRVPSSQSPSASLQHSPGSMYYRSHTPFSPPLTYTIIPPGSPVIYPKSYGPSPGLSPIAYAVTPSASQSTRIPPHGHQSHSPVADAPFPSQPHTNGKSGKPKRLKAHTVRSKNHNIPTIPRDKKGHPMLPLTVGIMTVISLGEVCVREHFHTERYIFPVGYEVTRLKLIQNAQIDAYTQVSRDLH